MRPERVGFEYPDLLQWQRWASSQRRVEQALRRSRSLAHRSTNESFTVWLPPGEVHTLVLVDKLTPSCAAAVVAPLRHLSHEHTAVVTPVGLAVESIPMVDELTPVVCTGVADLPRPASIVALGAYLELAQVLYTWSVEQDVPFFVVQHGLLTPWAPPAPRGAHVLAWSELDAEFWSSARDDLTVTTVGSQMLWEAAALPPVAPTSERPLVLGQLHGSELDRRETFAVYREFGRTYPSDYRPHPNEQDVVSRALHVALARSGVSFSRQDGTLAELARPVVSIFSTGTLEAATRGLPAWVYHPDPPAWVRDFWNRYELSEWGDEPTEAWSQPAVEPARAIADLLELI